MFAQYAHDDWRFGLGVYTPFGMSLTYNDGWFGKDHALTSKVKAIDIVPSVAYKLNDEWSVGAGVVIRHIRAQLSNTAMGGNIYSNMEGLSTDYTYQLGVMYEPTTDTRFGLSYRHKCTSTVKGSHSMIMSTRAMGFDGSISSDITLPEHVQFSAFHRLNDKIDLTASIRWTRWSQFKELAINTTNPLVPAGRTVVDESWKNTWTVAAGLDYHWTDNLTLRAGLSWDQAGVPDDEHRTARVPDSDRIITSIGVSYKYENWQFDAAYSHLFHKSAHSNHTTNGSTMYADYTNRINLIGVQVQYTF
jgi:long-chain fatty acid transport protein